MLECVISGSRSDPWTLPRMQPQFSHLLPLNQNDLNRRGPLWNGKIYDEPPRNSMGKLHTNLNWNKVKKIVHFQVLVPFDPFYLKTTFIDKWRHVQSRETGNIGYTRHMTNTNKTTQKTKEISNSKMLDIINSKHAQKTQYDMSPRTNNWINQKQKLHMGPCLLTDRDKMSNLYRGPSIHAPYQVTFHLAKRFQRRRFFRNRPNKNKNCQWRPYF